MRPDVRHTACLRVHRLLGSLFRRLVLSESAAEAAEAAEAAAAAAGAAGGDDGATPDGAGQPIDAVAAILLFHLASKSAVQRYTVGLLLMESPGTPQQVDIRRQHPHSGGL